MDKIWQILLQQRKNGLDSGGSCDCWRLPDFELGTSLGWHSKDTKVAAFIRERRNTVFQYFSLQLAYINSYIPATCFLHIEYTYRVSSFKASHTREKSQVDTWYIQYNSIQVLKREKSCREQQQEDGNQMSEIQFHIPIHLIHSNDFPKSSNCISSSNFAQKPSSNYAVQKKTFQIESKLLCFTFHPLRSFHYSPHFGYETTKLYSKAYSNRFPLLLFDHFE